MIEESQASAKNQAEYALQQNSCFACGADNPHGLRLQFQTSPVGRSLAHWTPEVWAQGFSGIVHGGVVSTVLDEAMSKTVAAAGIHAYTAELRIRLRQHVVPGRQVLVEGWIDTRTKRLIKTEASISDSRGTELAHAWASFLIAR